VCGLPVGSQASPGTAIGAALGTVSVLDAGKLEMWVGLAGTERFGIVDTSVWTEWMTDISFRRFPHAMIWL